MKSPQYSKGFEVQNPLKPLSSLEVLYTFKTKHTIHFLAQNKYTNNR